jgi:hypothetical protein
MNLQAKMLRVLEVGRDGARGIVEDQARGCARDLGHQRASGRRGARRALPAGSAVPPEHHRDPFAAAARTREDIPLLAAHFLGAHAQRYRKRIGGFDHAALQALLENPWQGNVRELNHVIERAVLMAQDSQIRPADLALRSGARAARVWKT